MKVYQPQISVKLIKAFKRKEIAPELAVVADRYSGLDGIDLTPLLSEGGSVQVTRSVRQPAGAFSITLVDKGHDVLMETVYAMIEPMDLIEIRMAREAGADAMPIVMRGFVSNIIRNETMHGDKPLRTLTVSGQDFGKLLQIMQIMYLYNTMTGDFFLTEFRWFENYAKDGDVKVKSAKEFVDDVLSNIINPYMQKITTLARFGSVAVTHKIQSDVSIDGFISPYTLKQFDNVSFYQVLKTCLDVPVFNEMFIEDREDGVYLVVRP
ncbi:MAG: hypothetical protein IBX56_13135, partial [Methylomicrobium sp.]|nr:hypothetical protein [Methylomicrobium sp.]